ncbi:MAG: hypothetical protein ACYC3Q_13295 [Gemmatimonadaceae bacterium]
MREAESFLVLAYEHLAAGRWEELLRTFPASLLDRARVARLDVMRTFREAGDWAITFGLGDPHAAERLSTDAFLTAGLQSLPADQRKSIRCHPDSSFEAQAGVVVVRFEISGKGISQHPALLRETRIFADGDRFWLHPSLLSPWLVPGMEGVLVSSP